MIEPLVISESLFQDLSEGDQKAVLEASKTATTVSAQFLRDQEARIKADLMKKGMEISDPANGEKEFIDLAKTKVWAKFDDNIGGKDKLNKVLKALNHDPVK